MTLPSGPPEAETGGRLVIDLAALQANYRLLAARAAPAECAAVVKADAYGLGAERISKALWVAGARTFFVAHPFEARILRAALPDAIIYVLSGLAPDAAYLLAEVQARPVLGSIAEVDEWGRFVKAKSIPGEAAIHIDTGINRLGLTLEETSSLATRQAAGLAGFKIALVMSHLACADTPTHPLNAAQLEAFEKIAALFPGVPASLANSAATLTGGAYRFNLCRPGIALYGGNPIPGAESPLQPVVHLEARIVQLRMANAGDSVGYGAAQHVSRQTRLAILSAGYADGLVRAAGSSDGKPGADVVIAGRRCPLVGRISMDLVVADITALPAEAVKRGDYATILGDGITIDELGRAAGTIGYEVLTRLGPRFARTYTD